MSFATNRCPRFYPPVLVALLCLAVLVGLLQNTAAQQAPAPLCAGAEAQVENRWDGLPDRPHPAAHEPADTLPTVEATRSDCRPTLLAPHRSRYGAAKRTALKAVAQDTIVQVHDMQQQWQDGVLDRKQRTTYAYDADGNQTKALTKDWQNGQWVNSSRTISTYDADGNRAERLSEDWQNDQWVNTWRYTYTYDADGKETESLRENWQNDQWVNNERITSTYDADGNWNEYLRERWVNGQWVLSWFYDYNADEQLLELRYKSYDETGLVTSGERVTYAYDASGNQAEQFREDWQNGQWVNDSRRTYTYDADGNRIKQLRKSWQNGQWVNSSRTTSTYDADGNRIERLTKDWQNDQWVNDGRYFNTYDADGNRTELLIEDWQNGQWVNTWRNTYAYDADGNWTKYLRENWQNDQWVNSRRETLAYDADGNWTEHFQETWQNDQWVHWSRATYTYGVLLPPPGAVTARATAEAATLSWPAVTSDSLAGYRLYRTASAFDDTSQATRIDGDGPGGLFTTPEHADDALAGAPEGTRYAYRVAAVSKSGLVSGLSAPAWAVARPAEITANATRSFDGGADASGYRLVALPGDAAATDVASTLNEGAAWRAFWDTGADTDYLVEHDGPGSSSERFRFAPGRGFWLVSDQDWTVEETFDAAPLADTAATVPLHDGWNIIANPLGQDVTWSQVEEANAAALSEGGALQPLWAFDGAFQEASVFASATGGEAFYFLNDQGLDALRIPYPAPGEAPSNESASDAKRLLAAGEDVRTLRLTATRGRGPASTVRLGITPGSGDSEAAARHPDVAHTDIVAPPPPPGAGAALWIDAAGETNAASAKDSRRSARLAAAYRPAPPDGQSLTLTLAASGDDPVRLTADGLAAFDGQAVALVDTETERRYDLTRRARVTLPAPVEGAQAKTLRLLVGTEAFVDREAGRLAPERLALEPNYPNPFHTHTTLTYALPEAQEVRLAVYDLLGREVAVLVDGARPAGQHRLTWDGQSRGGAPVASGVYFTRLEAGGEHLTQKLVIVR